MYRDRGPGRRQGVVYGDPRITQRRYGSPPGSGGGSPVQNLLMIAGAAVLFAVAGFFLLRTFGNAAPGGAPSPTVPAVAGSVSPRPSGSFAPSFSAAPTADESPTESPDSGTPSDEPAVEPSIEPSEEPEPSDSPSPEPIEPEVEEGPGAITFGAAVDRTSFQIIQPGVRFGVREFFAWKAFLRQPAGTTLLRLQIVRLEPDGTEELVDERAAPIADPRFQILVRRVRFSEFARQPGTYAVRYLRDDVVLAEGTLIIER